MSEVTKDFEARREFAAKVLMVTALGGVPLTTAAVFLTGSDNYAAIAIAGVFAVLGALAVQFGGPMARIGVGQAIVGQAIALTAAFAGHPWQIDMHMTFFAALAVLVPLVDIQALLFATATIAIHHLGLSAFLPSFVFPTTDILLNIQRSLIHGMALAVEAAVLCLVARDRTQVNASAEAQHQSFQAAKQADEAALEQAESARIALQTKAAEVQAARDSAEAALQQARQEQAEAQATQARLEEAQARQEEARREMSERANKVIEGLKVALQSLSEGNLNTRVTTEFAPEYEPLRQDYNAAMDQLRDALRKVGGYTADIRNDAAQISGSSEELAVRTERQAAMLEETAAALTRLTASIDEAASMAEAASAHAGEAQNKASNSGEIVERTVAAMGEIEASSGKIERITSVIDDISFQTSLLALNAGVEAARAGDAGRGFAVVASEVRALAQRSSEAAREINDLITASGRAVQQGVALVGQTGDALKGILVSVQETAGRIGRIATEARAQSGNLAEITSTANDLDRVTQQNAAMFEETTAAVQSLNSGAQGLSSAVADFVFEDLGDTARVATAPTWSSSRRQSA